MLTTKSLSFAPANLEKSMQRQTQPVLSEAEGSVPAGRSKATGSGHQVEAEIGHKRLGNEVGKGINWGNSRTGRAGLSSQAVRTQ